MNHGALSPTLSHQDGQQENARAILFSKKMQYLMLPPPSQSLPDSRSPCQVLPLKADGVEVTNIKHKALARSTGAGEGREAGLAQSPERSRRAVGLAWASQ